MAGSAADTPTTPESYRVSDFDRDRAVDGLRKEFVDGRLSHETFMVRMHAALDARNQGQLSGLFSDLPPRSSWLTRARQAVQKWRGATPEGTWDSQDHVVAPEPRYDKVNGQALAVPEPERAPRPLTFPPGTDTSFTIGRDQRCDLYLADMTVSRLHARLSRGADGWLLTDLGSSNGTRVNGWRLRAAVPVHPGDMITFGSAVFILRSEPDQGQLPERDPGHLEG